MPTDTRQILQMVEGTQKQNERLMSLLESQQKIAAEWKDRYEKEKRRGDELQALLIVVCDASSKEREARNA